MIGARGQRGFTLIELVVGMALSLIVITAAMSLLVILLNENRSDAFRDDAQADAQIMIDRLSRELRNAAAPTAGSGYLLEKATDYDLVFQSVSAGAGETAPAGNPTNQMRVRYCLDGNLTLWRQTETPSVLATNPTSPTTGACPSPDPLWVTSTSGSPCCVALANVTNTINGSNPRRVFTYGPIGWQTTSDIRQVQVSLLIDRNPGHVPGATRITSGIYLRNDLAAPTASFTATLTGAPSSRTVQLNGSSATDPQGQALSYQWYTGSGCVGSNKLPGGITQQYTAGPYDPAQTTSQTFSLQVTNTGGLSNCSPSQTVAIQ
jgi:prepilin-type N-terminal cleavage/methylation domain-containing protein